MLSVTNRPFVLSVILLYVVMQSVILLNVMAPKYLTWFAVDVFSLQVLGFQDDDGQGVLSRMIGQADQKLSKFLLQSVVQNFISLSQFCQQICARWKGSSTK